MMSNKLKPTDSIGDTPIPGEGAHDTTANLPQRVHSGRTVPLQTVVIAILVLFLLMLWLTTRAALERQGAPTKAGTNTIKISVQPSSQTMPPGSTYQIWVTADNPVAYISTRLMFDPSLLELSAEVSPVSALTRIVKITSKAVANTTGVLNLIVALDPSMRSSPPSGTFELATISMRVKTSAIVPVTLLHLDAPSMQAVNPDSSVFTITTTDATLNLNPVLTPTPTPTTVLNDTPTPTPTIPSAATSVTNTNPTLIPIDTPTPTPPFGVSGSSGSQWNPLGAPSQGGTRTTGFWAKLFEPFTNLWHALQYAVQRIFNKTP